MERKIGEYIKRSSGAIAVFVGASIVIGSALDHAQNKEFEQLNQISRELTNKYHVYSQCIGSGGSFGSILCGLVAQGFTTVEDRDNRIKSYAEELNKRILEEVPGAQEAIGRVGRDVSGLLLGSLLTAIGISYLLERRKNLVKV